MNPILILDAIFRIIHIGTAITLVGGSVFMAFVLLPSTTAIREEEHNKLRTGVISRWKKFVHVGVATFIISGFYNLSKLTPLHRGDSLYHALVGTKILLAFGMFFIAEALVLKSKAFENMRQNRARWLAIIVILAAIIVGISGFVKVRGVLEAASLETQLTRSQPPQGYTEDHIDPQTNYGVEVNTANPPPL